VKDIEEIWSESGRGERPCTGGGDGGRQKGWPSRYACLCVRVPPVRVLEYVSQQRWRST